GRYCQGELSPNQHNAAARLFLMRSLRGRGIASTAELPQLITMRGEYSIGMDIPISIERGVFADPCFPMLIEISLEQPVRTVATALWVTPLNTRVNPPPGDPA